MNRGELEDQAVEHLVQLHSGTDGAAARDRFQRWRERSAEHERAAREAEALWAAIPRTRAAQRHRRVSVGWHVPAVAAVLCLAVLIGLLVQPGGIAALSADYRTAVGERRLVELSDGSRAWLNSDTALSVDMSGRQRALRLHRGEALFEVAHDPQRPFVVRAAEREVRALGTRFDVNLLGRHMHVEVSEGIVQVDGADAPPLRLIAGQQVSLGEEMPVATVQPLDPDDASAWRRGKLIFNQRPLGDVLAEIERYLPGRILITDDALRQHRISGVADLDDPAALLASLDRLQSVRISRLPWLVVVRPAPES